PPTVMCAEYVAPPEPPLVVVRTSVDIDAPPETVWRHVVSFSDLPEPAEWIFHTGIAYPVRAPDRRRRTDSPVRVLDRPVHRADRGLGRASAVAVLRDAEPRSDGGVDSIQEDPP